MPYAVIAKIIQVRERRRTVPDRNPNPSDGCIRAIPDRCFICREPAPYCNDSNVEHFALCATCYDEQATFHRLDALVNG